MLTLYHSPMSRSTRIIALIHALGIEDKVDIRTVAIRRQDGSGSHDAKNPHPEGKVPLLVHNGVEVWESSAIMVYLTELFPKNGLGVLPGDPARGRFLSWMAWYGDVLEPVGVFMGVGIEHPALMSVFRGMEGVTARLEAALKKDDWLVAGRYTVADMIVASMFQWYPAATPDVVVIKDWVARCTGRPWDATVVALETKLATEMGVNESPTRQE